MGEGIGDGGGEGVRGRGVDGGGVSRSHSISGSILLPRELGER